MDWWIDELFKKKSMNGWIQVSIRWTAGCMIISIHHLSSKSRDGTSLSQMDGSTHR